MAQVILVDTKLSLSFETGINESGEPIIKKKTFSNISTAAVPDQLFLFAQAIATLSNFPVTAVLKSDSSDVIG